MVCLNQLGPVPFTRQEATESCSRAGLADAIWTQGGVCCLQPHRRASLGAAALPPEPASTAKRRRTGDPAGFSWAGNDPDAEATRSAGGAGTPDCPIDLTGPPELPADQADAMSVGKDSCWVNMSECSWAEDSGSLGHQLPPQNPGTSIGARNSVPGSGLAGGGGCPCPPTSAGGEAPGGNGLGPQTLHQTPCGGSAPGGSTLGSQALHASPGDGGVLGTGSLGQQTLQSNPGGGGMSGSSRLGHQTLKPDPGGGAAAPDGGAAGADVPGEGCPGGDAAAPAHERPAALSDEQRMALDYAQRGCNLFITGAQPLCPFCASCTGLCGGPHPHGYRELDQRVCNLSLQGTPAFAS